MRGGTDERRFRRSSERSEGEDKAMKVVVPRLRLRDCGSEGKTLEAQAGNGRKARRECGVGQRPATRSPTEKRSILKDISGSHDPEDPPNSMRAVFIGFGRWGITVA
jgi:hypothetical protein